MQHLNKFLSEIEKNSMIFKSKEIVLNLGLTNTQIKDLKKYALEKQLIEQSKQEYFLTSKGKEYLENNPLKKWDTKTFPLRPEINLESLKELKSPATLTKAIRLLAKYLLQNEPIKEFTYEHALFEELKKFKKIILIIEEDILNNKRNNLKEIFDKYIEKGLTKSIIAIVLLSILNNNIERIAIYEKHQFQIKFDPLMFDRMIACPENFEIQKTEMEDEYILKNISKIILNKTSNNILEITRGLYIFIKSLDKYTMNTQNLDNKTLRLRSVIVNAKDPISLFERDIPKALGEKSLKDCEREFLNNLKNSLNELKNCTDILIKTIKDIIFESFEVKTKEDLSKRFNALKDYFNDKDLKILLNTIVETDVSDELWIKRIATFINKSRVPKDWSDEDFADFKIKTKELALKFFAIESIAGNIKDIPSDKADSLVDKFKKLSDTDKVLFIRKVLNK